MLIFTELVLNFSNTLYSLYCDDAEVVDDVDGLLLDLAGRAPHPGTVHRPTNRTALQSQ